MRKFLLSLVVCLVSAAWLSPVSAYWIMGDNRLTPTEVTPGMKIMVETATGEKNHGFLGSWVLSQNYQMDECIWEVVDAGTNEAVNRPQFYFKQVSSGKYLGNNSNEGHLVSSTDDAYKICVFWAQAPEEGDENYNEINQRFVASGNSNWTTQMDELSVTLPINVTENVLSGDTKPTFLANSPDFGTTAVTTNNLYTSCRPWNLYPASEGTDGIEELTIGMTALLDQGLSADYYVAGTTPGLFNAEAVAKFKAAWNAAQTIMDDGSDVSYEQAKKLISDIKEAKANVDTLYVPITTGYYRIISAADPLNNREDGIRFAMLGTNSLGSASGVNWDTLNVKDSKQIFYVDRQDDGNYYVSSLRYGYFVNRPGTLPSQTDGKTEAAVKQVFTLKSGGTWTMASSAATGYLFYPNEYANAKGSDVANSNATYTEHSREWYLEPVTDMTLIDSLKQAALAEDINDEVKIAALQAQSTLDNTANVYDPDMSSPLIAYATSTSEDVFDRLMVSSTSGDTNNEVRMIDNNSSTYWHTRWQKPTNGHPKNNWIIAKLQEPVETVVFRMQGRQDNNYNNWATLVYIYGSNNAPDSAGNTDWHKVTEIGIPDIKKTSNKGFYTTPVVQLGQPYKYIKYYGATTNNGSASNGLAAMQYAEWNIFNCTPNPDKSASLREDMKQPIADFQAAIDKAMAAYNAGQGTQEILDELAAAQEKYLSIYPDPTELIAAIKNTQTVVDRAVDDPDTYGGTTSEAIETLTNKVLSMVDDPTDDSAYDKLYKLTRAEMNAKIAELNTAVAEFVKTVKTIEDGKVYFIQSAAPSNYYSDETHDPEGKVIYVRGTDTGSRLYWDAVAGDYDQNASAWWQAVKTSDSTFAFRNVASGWYLSTMVKTGTNYNLVDSVAEFKVEYAGGTAFGIKPVVGEGFTAYNLHAQKNGYCVVGWNFSSGSCYNNADSWTFMDVEDISLNNQPVLNNSVRVITLPYKTTEMPSVMGSDAQFYELVGAEKDDNNNVSVVKVAPTTAEFMEAGVPYIMVVGDTTQYNTGDRTSEDTLQLSINIDSENFKLDTTEKTANGLIAALQAKVLSRAGYGIFDGRNLVATDGTNKTVAAQTGYIDVANVEDKTAEALEVIDIPVVGGGILNSIKKALIDANENVNVYTIDGILVKKNVKAASATKSLPKGLYIIGKKKVLVK